MLGFNVGVCAVLLLASIIGSVSCQATTLQAAAQDVADLACPYAMLHGYGCPIPQSQKQPECGATDMCAPLSQASTSWPIGSVPVGVGFDPTTMSVALPLFYPEGDAEHVFEMQLSNQTYDSIETYAGALDPTATNALLTGALNTDMGQVYSTYFGSESMLHRMTQVDVITKAQLTSAPTLLPRVAMALKYLPEAFDATIYNEFIRYWGTHVITAAAIGGACESLLSVKSCFASGDATLLANEAQLVLGVKTMQTKLPTGESFNQAFMEHTTAETINMYGGDLTLIKPSQWTQRQRTIAQAPVLIKVDNMVPIADYINDTARKSNMQQAVTAYLAAAKATQQAAIAAAKAAQTFTVQAATSVEFSCVEMTFNYRYKHCHRILFWKSCHCDGRTACFTPGSCDTGCGGALTGTMVVSDMPSVTLQRGEDRDMSPDGSLSCACSNYAGYGTPSWPLQNLAQTVNCAINSAGQIVATNVRNPGVSGTQQDGQPVTQGCSIATTTYSGLSWTESGGNSGCGTTTGPMPMSGSITAQGWCCVGTTLAVDWSQPGCYGSITPGSCPGFND
jgi:hypothetical protein